MHVSLMHVSLTRVSLMHVLLKVRNHSRINFN